MPPRPWCARLVCDVMMLGWLARRGRSLAGGRGAGRGRRAARGRGIRAPSRSHRNDAVSTTARVLERDAELAHIEGGGGRGRGAGTAACLVVEGPAGIGKSSLVGRCGRAPSRRHRGASVRGAASSSATLPSGAWPASCSSPPWPSPSAHPRYDLFQAPAGVAARISALPGARPGAGEAEVAPPTPRLPPCTGSTGFARTWPAPRRSRSPSTMLTGPTAPPCASWPSCCPGWRSCRSRSWWPRGRGRGAPRRCLALLLADPLARVLRPAPLSAAAVGRLIEDGLGSGPGPRLRRRLPAHDRRRAVPRARAARGAARGGRRADERRGAARRGARRAHHRGAMLVRLGRLPAVAVRLARAVAVLETAELAQAADLAGLDAAAAAAADLPVAAEHPRPAPPAGASRTRSSARGSSRRCRRPSACARTAAPPSCSPSARARRARRRAPARDRARRRCVDGGAPDRGRARGRAAAARPSRRPATSPRPGRAAGARARAQILLDLGVAEATAGQPQGEVHLREALAAAGDDDVRLGAALVLAHVLGVASDPRGDRGHRPRRRPACRRPRRARVLLESMATGAGMLDAATAPAWPRACGPCAAPPTTRTCRARSWRGRARRRPRQRAAATCIALAQRALAAGPRIVPEPTDLPWFAQATIALVWADAHAEAQVPLDAGCAEAAPPAIRRSSA